MTGQPAVKASADATQATVGPLSTVEGEQTRERIPSLDGWRGISISFVLAYHSMQVVGFPAEIEPVFRWLPDGQFGVEVFFVISGFLITTLLLQEAGTRHRVSLGNFYARRALRIIPAYAAFLFVLFALEQMTALDLSLPQWLRLLTWTSNFGSMPWPAGHIWTLSVEEQFYLVWPLAFALIIKRRTTLPLLLSACAIPIILCPLIRIASYLRVEGFVFHPYSFFARADSLAWGCVLAVMLFHRREALANFARNHARFLAVIAIILILCPLVSTRLFMFGVLTVPFGPTANAIGISTLLVLSMEHSRSAAFAWLNTKPARAIGLWSYSIYLWQQLFCSHPAFFGLNTAPWYLAFPGWIAASVCAGIASYYLIEHPFLRLKARLPGRSALALPGEKS